MLTTHEIHNAQTPSTYRCSTYTDGAGRCKRGHGEFLVDNIAVKYASRPVNDLAAVNVSCTPHSV